MSGPALVRVKLEAGEVEWTRERLRTELEGKTIAPVTPVSSDGGKTWKTATAALQPSDEDRALGLFVPVKVEPTALLAGYLALFSFLLFGGPFTLIALIMAADPGPRFAVRATAVAIAFVLGPLPLGLLGVRARSALRKNPELTGHARAWFALAVAGLLALGCLVGLVLAVVR